VNIRPAVEADIPTILTWGKAFFDESVYSTFGEWSDASVEAQIRHMLDDPDSIIYMIDGVGMISGSIAVPYYSETIAIATELWWYVVPEERKSGAGRELLVAFGLWARESGATHVAMSTNRHTHPRVHDFFEGVGLHAVENSYIGVL
jgi:N-acetylglutamate synthase-like GNAT family acetyltransferase